MIAGTAVALIVAIVMRALLPPLAGFAATMIGIALGGFVAGKWAENAGLYHGAAVGVAWIVLEAVGVLPSPSYSSEVIVDTATVIVIDVVILAVASLGGWSSRTDRVSSSDTGRGR